MVYARFLLLKCLFFCYSYRRGNYKKEKARGIHARFDDTKCPSGG